MNLLELSSMPAFDFVYIEARVITKEFQQKVIQFDGTFQGLKITNCINIF